jgi:hypothetical protein
MGEQEFGRCPICGEDKPLIRKYYYYNIKCDCCSPTHFELRYHCKDCKPQKPFTVRVVYNNLEPVEVR